MGSGDRFTFSCDTHVWGLGIHLCKFPFDVTISVIFLCFVATVGFGSAYDDPKHGTAKDKS